MYVQPPATEAVHESVSRIFPLVAFPGPLTKRTRAPITTFD